jgi:2-polyprenyl-6-hydroxyphenyl methylase/3-demethylubiquinone-9 3-methyltransferase
MNQNIDDAEIAKFTALANRWWDRNSEFKPLHDINPLRLGWIDERAQLHGKTVLDVGCGGGILAEAMVLRGAKVTGIDAGEAALKVAQLHALESGVQVDYRCMTAEQLAQQESQQYDVITCLEMLEHVPQPSAVIAACAQLLKPGGQIFFSTINRHPKAYLLAIIGAEHLLKMLPKGTHDYNKLIKPAELHMDIRAAGLESQAITGLLYNPLTQTYKLHPRNVDVNYMVYADKPTSSHAT